MVRIFSKIEKDAIVARARRNFERRFRSSNHHKSCLHLSVAMCRALLDEGERAILQAGTCMWPRVQPDQDDGVSSTHFSYVWSPDEPASIMAIMAGNLPEMHVWVARPDANEIIDITTGTLPIHARECGMDWPGDPPPDYLWDSQLPDGVVYSPEINAIGYALAVLKGITDADRTS